MIAEGWVCSQIRSTRHKKQPGRAVWILTKSVRRSAKARFPAGVVPRCRRKRRRDRIGTCRLRRRLAPRPADDPRSPERCSPARNARRARREGISGLVSNRHHGAFRNDKNRATQAHRSEILRGSVGRTLGDRRSCDAKNYRRHRGQSAGNRWRSQCPSGCSENRSSLDLRL
jgi:hypothetical protein